MALDVGTLVASLVVDEKPAEQGLDRAEGRVKKFGQSMLATARLIGGAWVASKILPGVMDAINLASDLNESGSKVGVIFGGAADQIYKFAETAAESIGQSKQSALDAASTFAVFGKAAGLTGDELVKFSTNLVGLSSDLASFYNTSPEAAVEAIGAAMRGENEPIRQYGILLDEATIKASALSIGLLKSKVSVDDVKKAQIGAIEAQKKLNEATREHGPKSLEVQKAQLALKDAQAKLTQATKGTTGELSQQQKALAVQNAIMLQTKDAQGDFARTSSGLANQERILKAQITNLKVELGSQLLPVMLKIVSTLGQMVKWGSANKDWLIPLVTIVGTFVGALYLIVQAVKAWTAVQWALNVALNANPIGLIVLAIGILIAVIYILWTHSAGFRDFFIGLWGHIWSFLKGVGAWFAGPFVDFWVGAWHWIVNAAKTAWHWIEDKFLWLVGLPKRLGEQVGKGARHMWDSIPTAFKAMINWLIDLWNKLDFGVHITVPDWVPGIGGKTFGIDDIFVDLPHLAKGGVVPGSQRGTPVVMGDGRQVEIAAPEPMLRRIVREEGGGRGRDRFVTLVIEGRGVLRGLRKIVRLGGGDPDVVLVGE